MNMAHCITTVLNAAARIRQRLGRNLEPQAYLDALCAELTRARLFFQRERKLPDGVGSDFDRASAMDLVVENRIVVELKTLETFFPIHEAQVRTYMRLGDWPVGLLLNFGGSPKAFHRLFCEYRRSLA
jgi:GxxExxY protein